MLVLRKQRVLKKRSCTLAVRIPGNDEHSFEGADVAHRFAGLGEIGRGLTAPKVPLDIGVGNARPAFRGERISDAENDESSTRSRIENAGSIVEFTSFGA